MKQLSEMHLIQFSFWDFETFNLRKGGTAFIGPNGAGKTSLVDAVQIALIGAHGNYLQFNTKSAQKDARTIRDYALGTMRSGEEEKGTLSRKRDEALSYITLVFEGERPQDVVSVGICIHSKLSEKAHRTMGMYVLPGVKLEQRHHLEALDNDAFAPIDWNVFESGVRDLARKAGREPTITSHPEEYIRELLHSIQGKGPAINITTFLRALAQSLRLKSVQSVNDFIRENLVDAKPIDRQGTLKHIKTLQDLGQRIEEVKRQIEDLSVIESGYSRVATMYANRAAARAVDLELKIESTDARIQELAEDEERMLGQLEKLTLEIEEMAKDSQRQLDLADSLGKQIASDPAAHDSEQAKAVRDARQGALVTNKKVMERRMFDIRDSLDAVEIAIRAKGIFTEQLIKAQQSWTQLAGRGEVASVTDFVDTLHLLNELKGEVGNAFKEATSEATNAETHLATITGSINAANKGMRATQEDNLALAMHMLQQHGIESATVSSLVRVSDVRWQPAIESFLKRNRHALVVDSGREREAVYLLRNTHLDLYDAVVVQPNHVRNSIDKQPEDWNVGSLLVSDHPIALAYLRQIIGRMRMVKTEEDLETYDRALTVDGMLSANGGTSRLRLIPQDKLVLGAKVTEAEKQRLYGELMEAVEQDKQAKAMLAVVRKASEKLSAALQVDISVVRDEIATYAVAKTAFDALPSADVIALPERLQRLNEAKVAAQNAYKIANDAWKTKSADHRETGNKLAQAQYQLQVQQGQMKELRVRHDEASSDVDYNNEIAVRIYSEISNIADIEGADKAFLQLATKYLNITETLIRLESDTANKLRVFAAGPGLDVADELSDWRKAFGWVKGYKQRLTDSKLTEYQGQAEQARQAANEAFHHDVALKLREASRRIAQEINDLNLILRRCPEFTGRERYHFDAKVSSEFKWLHDMIEKAAYEESDTLQMFGAEGSDNSTLAQFLLDCETGENRGNNPLEDHRLLFNFDLEIHVDGKKVDTLSKRLGVGSNGEHLIPFYVIAGATLSNAYRIKPGTQHDGAALMLIDEAFHGFDAQNTYVTAQFLQTLGMQLVMAAPDSEIGKLIPVIDSYYDLWRHGPDVEADENIIKEEGKKLMASDIPDINPNLVQQQILDMSGATA